jgi:putative transposase
VRTHVARVRDTQPRVGGRKLHRHLADDHGVVVGRDALFTVLRDAGLLVKRKRRGTHTTYSQHGYAVAPNRFATLTLTGPRQAVVSDITYLRLARETFAYLFLVSDAFSRQIVGWHLHRDLTHHGALHALDGAVRGLREVEGLVHHSDRGSQYCCHDYLRALAACRIVPSMTDGNHCYQNAIAERINGILKDEFQLDAVFPTFAEARAAVARAVHTYNTIRLHGGLDLRTPAHVAHQAA